MKEDDFKRIIVCMGVLTSLLTFVLSVIMNREDLDRVIDVVCKQMPKYVDKDMYTKFIATIKADTSSYYDLIDEINDSKKEAKKH